MSIERVTGLQHVPGIYDTLKGIGNTVGVDGIGFVVIGEDKILVSQPGSFIIYKRTQTGIFLKF